MELNIGNSIAKGTYIRGCRFAGFGIRLMKLAGIYLNDKMKSRFYESISEIGKAEKKSEFKA